MADALLFSVAAIVVAGFALGFLRSLQTIPIPSVVTSSPPVSNSLPSSSLPSPIAEEAEDLEELWIEAEAAWEKLLTLLETTEEERARLTDP